MNNRQVLVLWLITIALAGTVAYCKFGRSEANATTTARSPGQTLLSSFPAADVAAIEIQGTGNATSLTKKDGKWFVTQREDYPANMATVNEFLRTLGDLKVTQGIQAGASFAPRFGLDEAATTADKRGITATFKNASGTELAKVSIDRRAAPQDPASPMGGGAAPNGRYIRNHADTTGFYRVSEIFPTLTEDPKRWLAEGFIRIEKIKSITVSQPDKADTAWKVTRETEEGEFTLADAKPGETLDPAATTPLKTLFSYGGFEDVIPAAKIAERVQATGKITATIETIEGFTYTLAFTPLKPAATPPPAPDPNNPSPTASDNYALTVTVAAELPKERKKPADEKPEEATAKDTAFADRHKALTEQLAKEQALAGRTFEIGKSAIDALLKDRASLIKKDAPPAAPAAPGGMPAPGSTAVTPPIEAVTPPVAIPPMDAPPPAQPEQPNP